MKLARAAAAVIPPPFLSEVRPMRGYSLCSLFVLAAVIGCGDKTKNDDSGDQGPAATSGEAKVELLEAGAEPREALRYKFTAGRSETMVMDMKMNMNMEIPGQGSQSMAMPLMRMKGSLDTESVSAEGNARLKFELTGAEIVPGPDDNALVVQAMRNEIGKIVGMKGTATVTPKELIDYVNHQ